MSSSWVSNRRPGIAPIAANDIHEAYCTCGECTFVRRRAFRGDLQVMAIAIACAVSVGGVLALFGPF